MTDRRVSQRTVDYNKVQRILTDFYGAETKKLVRFLLSEGYSLNTIAREVLGVYPNALRMRLRLEDHDNA